MRLKINNLIEENNKKKSKKYLKVIKIFSKFKKSLETYNRCIEIYLLSKYWFYITL